MGLFGSILNSAIRRTVNQAVDHAVDSAFNTIKNESEKQMQTCQIVKPDLSGEIQEISFYDGSERTLVYERADNLFDLDCGAAEVSAYYAVAANEDEAVEKENSLPFIYIEDDELKPNRPLMTKSTNMTVTQVVNHPMFTQRYEFDYVSDIDGARHYIAYKFYPTQECRNKDLAQLLIAAIPHGYNPDIYSYTVRAMHLIAATISVK